MVLLQDSKKKREEERQKQLRWREEHRNALLQGHDSMDTADSSNGRLHRMPSQHGPQHLKQKRWQRGSKSGFADSVDTQDSNFLANITQDSMGPGEYASQSTPPPPGPADSHMLGLPTGYRSEDDDLLPPPPPPHMRRSSDMNMREDDDGIHLIDFDDGGAAARRRTPSPGLGHILSGSTASLQRPRTPSLPSAAALRGEHHPGIPDDASESHLPRQLSQASIPHSQKTEDFGVQVGVPSSASSSRAAYSDVEGAGGRASDMDRTLSDTEPPGPPRRPSRRPSRHSSAEVLDLDQPDDAEDFDMDSADLKSTRV